MILYRLKSLKRQLNEYTDYHHKTYVNELEEINKLFGETQFNINNIVSSEISDEKVCFISHVPFVLPVIPDNLDKELNSLFEATKELDKMDKMEDIIKIVGREDLVAGYLGQTAIKTEALLRNNFGKVVFIDEAYSLVNDERDSFGMEALTVLNRFMSEYSDQIIIIFAGYKDMLDNTIFKYQPGLKRRCAWYFEIKGYSELGLKQIFENQMKKDGWQFSQDVVLDDFFKKYKKEFPNFGGSTLQLAFYCKLAYSTKIFDEQSNDSYSSSSSFPSRIIDVEILERAMKYLKDNNVTHKDETFVNHMYF